jgi:hypothetical protein
VTRARSRATALLVLALFVGVASPARGQERPDGRVAVIVEVAGATLPDLLGFPQVRGLASAGGAGLVVGSTEDLARFPDPARVHEVRVGLAELADAVQVAIVESGSEELLVAVVGGTASAEMRAAKDELRPLVLARGDAGDLLAAVASGGPSAAVAAGSLTSASTRREGVVTAADLAATVAAFIGGRTPELGRSIAVVAGPPPLDLYERYLAQRRMAIPVGGAAALYVIVGGLVAAGFVARPRSVPGSWRRVLGWVALTPPMLAVGLLAVGHLPELTYATAIPMIAIVTVFGTLAFSPLEGRDLTLVPAGIGVAVLASFAAEALGGWSGMVTPLVGGSQLDGGRFFGLPNVGIGVLVGASLWIAQRLRTAAGAALLGAVALFAGLPFLGANLGGALTLFAAAGLWLAIRERERLGLARGLAVVAAVTVVGTLVVLLLNVVSPIESHISRFGSDPGGAGGVLDTFVDRLRVGFDLIALNPLALIPVLGLPITLLVVLRPPPLVRASFERWPAWRDAILTIVLAGIVAYVAEDSGPAAAGFAFGSAVGGMLGVSLLASAGKMEER